MSEEQAERLIQAVKNLQASLIWNVGFGLVIAVGLAGMSIAFAIKDLTPAHVLH